LLFGNGIKQEHKMSRIDPWEKAPPSSKNQTAAGKHGEDESSESFRAATKAIGKSKAKNDKPVEKLAKALRKNDPTMDRRPKFKD
jgi:hypothetical protein